jgi:uncharacterized protein YgiB involved in biofilm formation
MENAYTTRLALLQMAKDLLMEEYYMKRCIADNKYHQQCTIDSETGKITEFQNAPKIPTSSEIIKIAEDLNKFVSKK